MNNPRQKKQLIILVGLLVVLVVVFYQAMDSSFPPDAPKVGTITSSSTFDELDGYVFKIGQGKDRREQRLIPASEISPVIQVARVKQSGTAGSCSCIEDIILGEHGIYMVIHRKSIQYGPVRSLIIGDKEFSYSSSPVHADYKLVTMRSQ